MVNVKGNLKSPDISGLIQVNQAILPITYLNTTYLVENQPILIEPESFQIQNIIVSDSKKNQATVNGVVSHTNFTDFTFDFSILSSQSFECLNTTEKDNEYFYGKAYADSAKVTISGNADKITMNIKGKTAKGTNIFIPLTGSSNITESEYITFVKKEDINNTAQKKQNTTSGNLILNLQLDITNDAKVQLVFDKTVGDVVKAQGHGVLNIDINSVGDLNIFGEYIIDEGDYLFTFQNVINKKFEIVKGSNLVWNGNPYDAELDIDAVYKVRTSLSSLLNDPSQTKRVPVDCHLKLTESLFSPNIKFDIDLPGANDAGGDELKSRIKTAIPSEEEMNKQVFALLVLGNFMPQASKDYSSSISSSSTSTEVLSNQLSNWLSQISKDFDVGVNYRPVNDLSNKEVELALSTQLLNERLVLEGNLGVTDNKTSATSQSSNNIVGDVKVEYKITEDGKLRAKVYNKANDYNLAASNSAPYTQGVGVFYRKEFDTFAKLIKEIFSKKEKPEKENQ